MLRYWPICAALSLGWLTLNLSGCSKIETGSDALNLREPAPSGSVVAQGSFVSANGKTVSGAALIYRQDDGTYVLRLESFNCTADASLQVSIRADGSTVQTFSLKAHQGNQNYSVTSVVGTPVWNSVHILNPTLASPQSEYGYALLQST